MRLLALDSATEACSVALWLDGEVLQRFEIAPQRHTALLLPMVAELCAEAGCGLSGLDAIAASVGPGAFTGVRVATALAQGLAYAHDLPITPVSTLAALAYGGFRVAGLSDWLVVQDARRAEVYWAHYRIAATGEARLMATERVSAPAAVVMPAGASPGLAGSGWAAHGALLAGGSLASRAASIVFPEARDVAALGALQAAAGGLTAAETLAPVYLRPAV